MDWSSQVARLRYYIDSTRTRSRIGPIADAVKRQRTRLITRLHSFERRCTRPVTRPRFIHPQEISIVLNRHLGWEFRATCSNVCHASPSAVSHLEESTKEQNKRMEERKADTHTPHNKHNYSDSAAPGIPAALDTDSRHVSPWAMFPSSPRDTTLRAPAPETCIACC